MTRNDDADSAQRQPESVMDRRTFLAVGGAVTTTLIAGCTGGESSAPTGTFQLYISDQPIAIDEFDSLEVTIDGARLFRAEESTDGTATTTTNANTTVTTEATGTAVDETTTTSESAQEGFVEIDIDDETVDLTTLPGEKAMGVFDGELPVGRYSSVHLSVAQVDGVVDGDTVEVQLPSERLKLVKPFEVTEDEPIQFVFDITVVKKGQSGGYNLLPVIGESGVVGKDVEMQEVERNQ